MDCPFCEVRGDWRESSNHRAACPLGNYIDERDALLEQAGAALEKSRKPVSWSVVELHEPDSLLAECDAALAALRAAGIGGGK